MSAAQATPETSRYRSRYLKLKSVLHDRTTGYPAVAVLLDQLRSRLDGRRALGVLHVAIENLPLVESLYGWQVLDRVLSKVAFEIREACGEELPKETLLAINAVAGDSFAAFVIERTDGREVDAAFMRAKGDALRGRIEAALGDDEFTGLGPQLTVRVGHALLSRNPFYRFERRVYAALNEAAAWETEQRHRRKRNLTHELQRIIQDTKIETVFQPVVDLRTHTVLGYEARRRLEFETVEMHGHLANGHRARGIPIRRHAVPSPTSKQTADARQQLVQTERFRQIVVGPLFEAAHAVVNVVLGRQNQDRNVVSAGSRPTCDLETTHLGQHQVEDDQIEFSHRVRESIGSAGSIPHHLDRVALGLQIELEPLGEMGFVLDDQNSGHQEESGAARRVTTKRLPSPAPPLRATTRPPWRRTRFRTMNNPSPSPAVRWTSRPAR